MTLAQFEHDVLDTCFKRAPSDADFARLGDVERWRIYRNMVRARLRRVNESALPRTRRALGVEAFDALVDAWLEESPPRTRYFREVPQGMLTHALPSLRAQANMPWLADLARYELTSWQVNFADDRGVPATTDFTFDQIPVLTPAHQLLTVGWNVHRKNKRSEYAEGELHLCLYRNAEHKTVTMELNPLAHDLMASWAQAGDATLAQRVQQVTTARSSHVDEGFIEGLSTLLADFLERGIMLGSRAQS